MRTLRGLSLMLVLTGALLMVYPFAARKSSALAESRITAVYEETADGMEEKQRDELREDAIAYNRELLGKKDRFHPDEAESARYRETLDVGINGLIGSLWIPKLSLRLPIRHSIDEAVLMEGAGHLPGSSFPVGGESTHAVLCGHCGLPDARLFTELDELRAGDVFSLTVLDRTLTYEVYRILVRLPGDTERELAIRPGEDLCTLITCTPYGVNSHRLLVRGRRILHSDGGAGKTDAVLLPAGDPAGR